VKLRFFAKDDLLVSVPGSRARQGMAPEYVGRKFVPGDPKLGTSAQHPASPEPYEVELNSEAGFRLVQLTRRDQCLWPADEETARECGAEFVKVEIKDGVAAVAAAPPAPSPKKKPELSGGGAE
jgi:hypothetical protein